MSSNYADWTIYSLWCPTGCLIVREKDFQFSKFHQIFKILKQDMVSNFDFFAPFPSSTIGKCFWIRIPYILMNKLNDTHGLKPSYVVQNECQSQMTKMAIFKNFHQISKIPKPKSVLGLFFVFLIFFDPFTTDLLLCRFGLIHFHFHHSLHLTLHLHIVSSHYLSLTLCILIN